MKGKTPKEFFKKDLIKEIQKEFHPLVYILHFKFLILIMLPRLGTYIVTYISRNIVRLTL